ncbi:hypothetical protein [Tsukamurella paurometabola]|uniref:hypothetical protein n=1 Tax=Tsukamurella paurometabola TaxID=2061 RepID=UPI0011C01DB6|nr:hypothetical protein [Tsukamurella paurometabola]
MDEVDPRNQRSCVDREQGQDASEIHPQLDEGSRERTPLTPGEAGVVLQVGAVNWMAMTPEERAAAVEKTEADLANWLEAARARIFSRSPVLDDQ